MLTGPGGVTPTFTQVTSHWKDTPIILLKVAGRKTGFMVDSGATSSVLNEDLYKGPLRESDPSMGINGVLTKTYKTKALPIETVDGEYITDHTFSIIPDCPVSLLGRDLFVKLDLRVTVENDGLSIQSTTMPIIAPVSYIFVNHQDCPELKDIDPNRWSQGDYDTGLIYCTPYEATLKEGANLSTRNNTRSQNTKLRAYSQ